VLISIVLGGNSASTSCVDARNSV